jgi:alginate O-acetyltransferase complex protein AlgI
LRAAIFTTAVLLVAAYWWAPTTRARRRILAAGTVALGALLSYRHLAARRLSVAFFFFSIFLVYLVFRVATAPENRSRRIRWGILVLVLLFVGLKWTGAQRAVYGYLHIPERYYVFLGAWLGASYLLFRLLHVLLEARKPDFPKTTFFELFLYALLPATLLAGPIDRFPRFLGDCRFGRPEFSGVAEGLRRIVVGIFKKFVIADYLAALPVDFAHAGLSTARMWASLYLFGLEIYFDFAGYSDLAIGSAKLFGFSIPENFDNPYLKRNITRFWQSWHATLSNWMRDYVFFPLARAARKNAPRVPADLVLLTCHLTTMVLIGLWHGLFAAYAMWGAWHGIGLFLAKKWSDRRRGRPPRRLAGLRRAAATVVTFQFVTIGWIFFYAPDLDGLRRVAARLAGIG